MQARTHLVFSGHPLLFFLHRLHTTFHSSQHKFVASPRIKIVPNMISECLVCFGSEWLVTLQPCTHRVFCLPCFNRSQSRRCSVCRTRIDYICLEERACTMTLLETFSHQRAMDEQEISRTNQVVFTGNGTSQKEQFREEVIRRFPKKRIPGRGMGPFSSAFKGNATLNGKDANISIYPRPDPGDDEYDDIVQLHPHILVLCASMSEETPLLQLIFWQSCLERMPFTSIFWVLLPSSDPLCNEGTRMQSKVAEVRGMTMVQNGRMKCFDFTTVFSEEKWTQFAQAVNDSSHANRRDFFASRPPFEMTVKVVR